MSRLDSFIRRLLAQRACLDEAARLVRDLPGAVLEFGLGNGRTYDHLCGLLPEREIFVFDRRLAAHPSCAPDWRHMIVGDFRATVPMALARIGAPAALAHLDVGSGEAAADQLLASWLGPALAPLLGPRAVVVADQALMAPGLSAVRLRQAGWAALALPAGVEAGRYFMYRTGLSADLPARRRSFASAKAGGFHSP